MMLCPFRRMQSTEVASISYCVKCANSLSRHRNVRAYCYRRSREKYISTSRDFSEPVIFKTLKVIGRVARNHRDGSEYGICLSVLLGRCIRDSVIRNQNIPVNRTCFNYTLLNPANSLIRNQATSVAKLCQFHTSASRFTDKGDGEISVDGEKQNQEISEKELSEAHESSTQKNESEEKLENTQLGEINEVGSSENTYGKGEEKGNDESFIEESSEIRTAEISQIKGDKIPPKKPNKLSSQTDVDNVRSEKGKDDKADNLSNSQKTGDQQIMKEVAAQYCGEIDEIKTFLKDHNMETVQGHTCYVTSCPKLGKLAMKKKVKSEGERLFINSTSGHFMCEHCKKSGSWLHLKDNITALKTIKKNKKVYVCFDNIEVEEEVRETPQQIATLLETGEDINKLPNGQLEQLLELFDWQGIKKSTLVACGAKCIITDDRYTVLLPVRSFHGVVVGVRKFVAVQKSSEDDEEPQTSIRSSYLPRQLVEPFGWQSVKPKSESIVITGSEVDSLAITQNTEIPSIALKNLTFFPLELLPYLERFKKIILWIGNDVKAWQSSKQFAKKLNDHRCHVFRPDPEMQSPLEAIRCETPLTDLLRKARPIGHDSIVTFPNLRQEVYSELAQLDQVTGVKWTRYSPLNKIMKGHRPGELTVLTGPTGSGKTTFASDYSLDLCMQGVNTLWGSFEISNVRLAKVMLQQFAGRNMTKNIKEFDVLADQFAEVPMFFMTYFGQEEVEKVIEAMSHAVYVHDICHVIVDNLQFMMGMNYSQGSRFFHQDKIISIFRRFATKMNCHVTLIIHPRKENDGEELMMASIFGSAKAVQEADNVLILQDMRLTAASGRKYIQIMKNRYDGELGVMMMKFDKECLRFVPTQKKSPSQKINEKEEGESGENDIEIPSTSRKKKAKKSAAASLKSDSSDASDVKMKFKKLGETGHDFEDILDIDTYYSR